MTTAHQQLEWRGMKVVDRNGAKVGSLEDVYFDQQTDRPEWATIKTGIFGSRLSFVPLTGASSDGETVRVAYDKAQIKDAPNIDVEEELSPDEEDRLYRHYGADYSPSGDPETDADRQRGRGEARRQVGRDVSASATDDAMTRSEEELDIRKSRRSAGTARLRKFVDTEHESQAVPLEREKARVTREPITDANRDEALDGADISSEEHEVTLMAEEPVAEKRTVGKERVRVDKERVTEEQTVSEDLRKERIDVEGDVDANH